MAVRPENFNRRPDSLGHMFALGMEGRDLVWEIKQGLGDKLEELTKPLGRPGEWGSFYDGPRTRTHTEKILKQSQRPPVQQPPFTADLSPLKRGEMEGLTV